jgi:formyl-CoA transferase
LTERDSPTAIGPALSDQITSLYGVQGTLAALVSREKTGQGQVVQVNMLAASMAFLTAPIAEYTMLGGVDGPYTRARRSLSFAFLSKDELSFAVHLSSPAKFWDGLLAAVNAGHLARDSRFKDKSARVEHYRELHSLLAQIFRTRTRADWLNELWEHNVPAAPIYDIAEALSDPQAVHLDMVQAFGQGDDAIELVRYPVTFERTPCDRRDGVPRLGQHNDYYGISERD